MSVFISLLFLSFSNKTSWGNKRICTIVYQRYVIYAKLEDSCMLVFSNSPYYYYFMNIHVPYCLFIGWERFSIKQGKGISIQLLLPEVLLVSIRAILMISKYCFIHNSRYITVYRIHINKIYFEIFNIKYLHIKYNRHFNCFLWSFQSWISSTVFSRFIAAALTISNQIQGGV